MLREAGSDDDVPQGFRDGLDLLAALPVRAEITLQKAPAPTRLAPFAHALTAAVADGDGEEMGSGRLVLLHDPARPDSWETDTRLVAYVEADVDADMAADPLITAVGWSWLQDCLRDRGVAFRALGGTTTVVRSMSYGVLADRGAEATLQIRCSWSPLGAVEVADHAAVWVDLLAVVTGLPPEEPGVTRLPGN